MLINLWAVLSWLLLQQQTWSSVSVIPVKRGHELQSVGVEVQKIKSKVLQFGEECNLKCLGPEFWDDLALSICCVFITMCLKCLFQYILLQLWALSRFVDQVMGYHRNVLLSKKSRLSCLLWTSMELVERKSGSSGLRCHTQRNYYSSCILSLHTYQL